SPTHANAGVTGFNSARGRPRARAIDHVAVGLHRSRDRIYSCKVDSVATDIMNTVVADRQVIQRVGIGVELEGTAGAGVGNLIPSNIDVVGALLKLHSLVKLEAGAGGRTVVVHEVAVQKNALGR